LRPFIENWKPDIGRLALKRLGQRHQPLSGDSATPRTRSVWVPVQRTRLRRSW